MSSIVVVVADAPEEAARLALHRLLPADSPSPELVVRQRVAIGVAGPGTGAQDPGDRSLVTSASGTIHLALDGRLTNRDDLVSALGRTTAPPPSDPELFLQAYERWGEAALGRIEGTFAVAIVDATDQSVLLARDAIGDKTLFYGTSGDCLVVASEEVGVLSHPAFPRDVDDLRLAAHFGMVEPESGATFFRHVKEVPPAHVVAFRSGRLSLSRYWEPGRLDGPRFRTDEEWAEVFVDRLDRAVARCLSSSGRAAVLLSGGLDSCPIAALAARRVAPARLTAISWVFDELHSCDERLYIAEVSRIWGLDNLFIPSDQLWPLSDFATWPTDPNRPEHDGYRRLILNGYRVARDAGVSVLLSGFAGDHLYIGAGDWLFALLREGRSREALSGLLQSVREIGAYRAIRSLVVSPLVPRRLRRRPIPKGWLTPYAQELLRSSPLLEKAPPARERQRKVVLSEWMASCAAREIRRAGEAGIELRYPFRDGGVVSLALAIPSHQLERGRSARIAVRRGFRHLLPESVVTRPRKTSLRPLSDRGMFGPGRSALLDVLSRRDGLWAGFVEPDWVAETIRNKDRPESELAAVWYCAFVDLWSKRVLE